MVAEYLQKKGEKDERARIRIKEQVLQIYEQKTFEQFEENDPNFNKIIIHIERVLKITTAQTLAIDSLERKITNLSKRNLVENDELNVVNKEDNIKKLLKERKKTKKENNQIDSDESQDQNPSDQEGTDNQNVRFENIFPDIQEDKFESSDDDDEKKKNYRLERLGQVAAPHK